MPGTIHAECAIGCDRDGREQTLREYISELAELGEPGIPYAQCDLGRVTSRDEASGGTTSHDRPVEGPSGRAKRLRSWSLGLALVDRPVTGVQQHTHAAKSGPF